MDILSQADHRWNSKFPAKIGLVTEPIASLVDQSGDDRKICRPTDAPLAFQAQNLTRFKFLYLDAGPHDTCKPLSHSRACRLSLEERALRTRNLALWLG